MIPIQALINRMMSSKNKEVRELAREAEIALDKVHKKLLRADAIEVKALLVLTDGHENFGINGWMDLKDHDETLDALAETLNRPKP